ncbi:unnamed protein product [Adineta ricciae]|uniref:G-protein coupled receptors family 1 profile domain-containing protein n=1 Tax=Adineta ricciae TaxID=249248 RepID=A0A813TLM0_ADIRI|nr:unnamed protein product [Adineta ricciae]
MNSTLNASLPLSSSTCSLQARVYSSEYLFIKLLNATYLRLLIGPGILLNTLCLLVLSRPRISNKSTTIVFLRFLAVFDILAITLKYIRAEINYQSTEKGHQIFLLIPSICKTLYVLMNSSISIAMWTIALMSLDKAVAVTYPFKSGIWVTTRRAVYICCLTIIVLLLANLAFIKLSGIRMAKNHRKYCGLIDDLFIVDLLTASILPIATNASNNDHIFPKADQRNLTIISFSGIITLTNIVIAVVLHRDSNVSLDSKVSDESPRRETESQLNGSRISVPSFRFRSSASSSITTTDLAVAAKRRASAQVTRMLLAVTLSLIICNIPNTLFFVFVKDTRQILNGRLCSNITDHEITLYKFGFYSSVLQDILSDLPHIFNFFLYCLAGKKFRSIFISKVRHVLYDLGLIKSKERRLTHSACPSKSDYTSDRMPRQKSNRLSSIKSRKSIELLLNGSTCKTVLNRDGRHLSLLSNSEFDSDGQRGRAFTSLQ